MDALDRAVAEDRAGGLHAHRRVRQRGRHEHRRVDPLDEHGGLLRAPRGSGCTWTRPTAASRCSPSGAGRCLRGHGAGRLDHAGRPQVALPALRGRVPAGAGRARPGARRSACTPSTCRTRGWGMEQVNFADRGLQLTRSFRALKVWMSIQTFGMAAFRRAVARGHRAGRPGRAPTWRLRQPGAAEPGVAGRGVLPRSTRASAGVDEAALERINEAVQARVIESGMAMMSSTRLRGVYALRLCILAHHTTWRGRGARRCGAIERFGRGGRWPT